MFVFKRENLAIEESQVTSMFNDPQPSPRTETQPSDLPSDSNIKINVELPEKSSDPVELFSTEVVEVRCIVVYIAAVLTL